MGALAAGVVGRMLVVLSLLVVAVALAMAAETVAAATASRVAAVEVTTGQRSASRRALSRMGSCRRLRSLRRPSRPRHPCRLRCRETCLWTSPIPQHRRHLRRLRPGDSRQASQGCSHPARARPCGSSSSRRRSKTSKHYRNSTITSGNNRHNRSSCRRSPSCMGHLRRLRPWRGRWATLGPLPHPPRQLPACHVSSRCLLAHHLPQRQWGGAWRRLAAAVGRPPLPALGAHSQGCPPAPLPQGWARVATADTPLAIAPPAHVAELPMGGLAPRAAWASRSCRSRAAGPPPAAVAAASGRGHPSARAPTPPRLRPTLRWRRPGRRRWGLRPPRQQRRRRQPFQPTLPWQRRGAPRHRKRTAYRRGRRSTRPPRGSERSPLLCPIWRRPRRRKTTLVRHRMYRRMVQRCPNLEGAVGTAATVTRAPMSVTRQTATTPQTRPPLGPAFSLAGLRKGS